MPEERHEIRRLHGLTVQQFELVDSHTEITFTDGTKVKVVSIWDGRTGGVDTHLEVHDAPSLPPA